MSAFIILQQMTVIAILVSLGIFLYKMKRITDSNGQLLSMLVLDVCNPAMVLSFAIQEKKVITHQEILMAVAIAVAVYLVLIFLGVLLPVMLQVPGADRKFYNAMVVYGNVGFLGIPVASAILSGKGMVCVVIFNVIFSLCFYTHGIYILGCKETGIPWKNFLSPGIICSLLTIVLYWTRMAVPLIIENTMQYLGSATVFLSMLLLGVSLAKSSLRKEVSDIRMWIFVFIRMILLPLAFIFVFHFLSIPKEMGKAFVLMVSMPVASMPMIQAERAGNDTRVISRGILLTTMCSFLSVSLLMGLFY